MDPLNNLEDSKVLAANIRAYWRKKGQEVVIHIEKEDNIFVIRSNIKFQMELR